MVSVVSPLAAGGSTVVTAPLRPSDVLGAVEAVPPHVLLRGADDLLHARLAAADDVETGHLFAALRRVRRRAHARRAHRGSSSGGTAPCRRGLRPVGVDVRRDDQPGDGVRKPGTVGLPLPGQEIAIADNDGRLPPKAGRRGDRARGERHARLPRPPEETAPRCEDGWLHTGDVGYLDADGYLVLVDRMKDMIIRGGENIYPKEIENVLLHAIPPCSRPPSSDDPTRPRRGAGRVRLAPHPGIVDTGGTGRAVLDVAGSLQGAARRDHPRRPAEEPCGKDRQARVPRAGDGRLTTGSRPLLPWAVWSEATLVYGRWSSPSRKRWESGSSR